MHKIALFNRKRATFMCALTSLWKRTYTEATETSKHTYTQSYAHINVIHEHSQTYMHIRTHTCRHMQKWEGRNGTASYIIILLFPAV